MPGFAGLYSSLMELTFTFWRLCRILEMEKMSFAQTKCALPQVAFAGSGLARHTTWQVACLASALLLGPLEPIQKVQLCLA